MRQLLRRLILTACVATIPLPALAQGTVAPVARQQFLDNDGNPLSNGRLYVYQAGTTTPATIYTDSTLTVAARNAAVCGCSNLDFAGRFTYFLSPSSYRFTLKTSANVLVWDVDNVSSVPPASVNLDIDGTAGEALTAGDVVYISDGSGGKNPGSWYRASATNTYSSTDAGAIGVVPASIASAGTGSIRMSGRVSTASGVSVGLTYYVGTTAGSIVSTAPANGRVVGFSDSTTTLVLDRAPTLGKQTLWVPANAMSGTVTNGATGPSVAELTAANPNITALSFVNAAQKFAQFAIAFPKSWNASTLTYQVFWTGTAAGAGDVTWGLQCVASGDNATLDVAFGTAVEVTDTFLAVKFAHVSAESAAVTVASAGADKHTTCQVYRKNGGTDTRAAASLLLGIKLFYTTNVRNDK